MSRIDDLITQRCPRGVEHKALGQVGEFIRGQGLQKADLRNEGVPAVHYGQIHSFYGVYTTETKSFTDPGIASRLRHAKPGDLLIATTSEDDVDVAKATAWLGGSEVVLSGDAYIYRHELDPRYMAYFFQSRSFHDQKRRFISGTKVRRISGAAMARIFVPVPPPDVQREIVKILDQFTQLATELEAELEAELRARQQQFDRYRDLMITDTGVPERVTVPLRDLAGDGYFGDGDWVESKDQDASGTIRLTQLADVGEGVFRNRSDRWMREDQAAKLRCTLLEPGDILIARMPAPLGRACQVPHDLGAAATVVDVAILRTRREDVWPRYIMHALNSSEIRMQILRFQTSGTRQRISRANLGEVLVPLPDVDMQRRISVTLDRLDAAARDLSIGLREELAARRKQYDYYRDNLLTFPEAAS